MCAWFSFPVAAFFSLPLTSYVFRRNATHCISPYAIVMCVCVCVCLCVSVCVCLCVCVSVCMPRLWTPGKRFEVEMSFFFKLRGMSPDIASKSFTQIVLQIPRWRTKLAVTQPFINTDTSIFFAELCVMTAHISC